MELAALVEGGTMFCNCKEWKKTVLTEKIDVALYVWYSAELCNIFVVLFGVTLCFVIGNRQWLNISHNTGISVSNML
jgi:hypothetical protein